MLKSEKAMSYYPKETLKDADSFEQVFKQMMKMDKKYSSNKLAQYLKIGSEKLPNVIIFYFCAHGGFNFDFKLLINNMQKHKILLNELEFAQLHFADTLSSAKS